MTRAVGEIGEYLEKPVSLKKGPKPMPKVNAVRAARLEERNFGAHGKFIRTRRCVVEEYAHPNLKIPCMGRIVACHLTPRGMGGCKGDRFSLFPACELHHSEQEGHTTEFQELYGLDLALLVEDYNILDPSLSDEEREAARRRRALLREPR